MVNPRRSDCPLHVQSLHFLPPPPPHRLLLSIALRASSHGGGVSHDDEDDDANSDSPPSDLRARSLILMKICCLILVFCGTFTGGISPYFLKWNESFLLLGTQFAGGVFLGTALMHLLNDSNETFKDQTKQEYPFSFMLAGVGYLVTMFADAAVAGVDARVRSIQRVKEVALVFICYFSNSTAFIFLQAILTRDVK